MSGNKLEQKLAIRLDDPPSNHGGDKGVGETEHFLKLARENDAVLTLAIPMGRLQEWTHLQDDYLDLYKEGLLDPVCHGYYHEDYAGTGANFLSHEKGSDSNNKLMKYWFGDQWRGLDIEDIGEVMGKCQDFAKEFFGQKSDMWIAPFFREPPDKTRFGEILVENDYNSISNQSVMDPLCASFIRGQHNGKDLYEVPFTIWIDAYERPLASTRNLPHNPSLEDYVEATKEHIKFRFDRGLYVCILTHTTGFQKYPMKRFGYKGDNTAGRFFDTIYKWTRDEYPDAEFVGMKDLY